MTAIVTALGLAVVVLGILVVGLLRTHADILRALHDLGLGLDGETAGAEPGGGARSVVRTQVGVPAPRHGALGRAAEPIVGTTPAGGSVAISLSPRPHATVLAFLSSGCSTCVSFWTTFRGPVDLPGEGTQLVIVTRGPDHESPAEIARLAPPHVTTVQSSDAWARFDVPGSPYFALVDGANGQIVGEGSATTWEHVVGLLQRAVDDGGVRLTGTPDRAGRGDLSGDAAAREARIDRDLAAAGITPGHSSLYPTHADGVDHGVPDHVED